MSEGSTKETVVSITDDDVPSVEVSFEQGSYTVAEGSTVTVKVQLDAAPERTVTIPITKAGQGGATGADYSGVPANVVFNASDTEKTFDFSAASDSDNDDGESVKLGFDSLPAGVTAGTTNEAIVSITDDDVPSVEVSFEQGSYTVAEGGSVTVKVQLDAAPERTVTIPITKANQDGATSADYSGVPANVVFNANDTEKSFTFSATADDANDDGESVKLTFGSTLPAGVSEGSTKETVVSITDDDVPSVEVSFEQGSYTVAEGGSVTVKVQLDAAPERTVTIPLTKAGQGGATSADYSGVPANVVFNASDTEKTFDFSAASDSDNDDGESVKLGFESLPSDVSTASPAQAVVAIHDSIHVSFEESYYEAYEGGAGAKVTVKLDGPALAETTISITATGMDGASSADWTGVPPSVTFDSLDTEKSFTVMAYDDTVEDNGETVQLGFDTLPPGVARGNPATATVVLMNRETTEAQTECPGNSGRRILLNSVEEITQEGQSQFLRVKLDPNRVYLIEVYGNDSASDIMGDDTYSENLTLEDPRVLAVWNEDRTMKLQGRGSGNKVDQLRASVPSGWHQLEITGNGSTGTYRIKVRVNNICTNNNGRAQYPWFGGPDGYVFDAPAYISSSGTTHHTSRNPLIHQDRGTVSGFLGDNWDWYWDEIPDVDWHEWTVEQSETGQTYEIEVRASEKYPIVHQATDLEIKGIYDAQGDLFEGTSESGTGEHVSINFEPSHAGKYYIAVGTGATDRTGMYEIKIVKPGQANGRQSRNSKPEHNEGQKQSKSDGEQPNRPASGKLRISGEAQVGQTLTADTSGIQDQDGLEDASFSYQWLGDDSEIAGATGPTYTLADADAGKTIKVRVSFTDDEGNDEALTSAATVAVEPEHTNTPAAGQPLIEGEARVGQTLTVDTSGVQDQDGLENASFSYQWLGDDAEIAGATGSTYTLADADAGKTIKVRVSFTDDEGNDETLTSAATVAVEPEHTNTPAAGQPVIDGEARVGRTLTADASGIQDQDGLENASFSYQWLGDDSEIAGATGSTYTLADADAGKTIKVRVSFTDDEGKDETLTSAATVAVEPEHTNTPAAGQPVIDGEARVGRTLTADASGIQDQDGLENASFSYQWLDDDAEIAGATGSTYTLADADAGKTIKVRVSFTDDEGNDEALTSAATVAVEPTSPTDPPPQPTNLTAVVNDDGSVTLNWDAPNDDSVTGYQILRRRPSEGENDLLVYVEEAGSTATTYTDTEVTAGVRHFYRVKATNEAGLSQQSNYVRVDP